MIGAYAIEVKHDTVREAHAQNATTTKATIITTTTAIIAIMLVITIASATVVLVTYMKYLRLSCSEAALQPLPAGTTRCLL